MSSVFYTLRKEPFISTPFQDVENSKDICYLLIGGRINSGKSYIAKFLSEEISIPAVNIRVFHFANGVKGEAKRLGWDGNKDGFGRKLLQVIGGTGRLYSNGKKWAQEVYEESLRFSENKPYLNLFVVDDFRYPEEFYLLSSKYPTFTMWVDRPELGDDYNYNYWRRQNHESELALQYFKLWNFVFVNDSSYSIIEPLKKLVFTIIEAMEDFNDAN